MFQVTTMYRAISLSFAQLGDPAIVRVLLRSLAVTMLIFGVLIAAMIVAARWAASVYGWGQEGGLVAGVIAAIVGIIATWLLFRAIAIPVMNIFADDVVTAVEAKHYQDAAKTAHRVTLGKGMRLALGSVLRLIGFNLLALPIYIILIFTAIGPFILFLIVNALLIGRDLAEMVAARHLGAAEMRIAMRAARGSHAVMGAVVTVLLIIPFLNLVAPLLGAAIATHLFHIKEA